MMASSNNDLIGKTLGTCTLEKLIGRGGMGTVYLARQIRPSRQVAVKVLLPNAVMDHEVRTEFLARFRREADLIARLEHVNIMPIHEYGEQDGLAYLVMPYLAGGSLRDVLARQGALSLQETARYMKQAAEALDYAHKQGVIHRDLKPANFLLHSDGRLVLADFGIARMMQDSNSTIGATLTGTGMLLGTPEYMAPEMASGESVDYRADIYELGIVLFQMLCGQVPFQGSTPYAVVVKHLQEPLPSLHRMNPGIPIAVDAVVQKATAKKREDRYISAGALAQALQGAINGPGPFLETPSLYEPTVLSPNRQVPQTVPVVVAPPKYDTPPVQYRMNRTTEPPLAQPVTPHGTPYIPPASPSRQQPWLIIIGILFAVILVIGGVLVGLQLNRGTTGANSSDGTVATSHPNASPTAGTTTIPTSQPTAVSTPTTAITPQAAIPFGTLLYSATSPGEHCDTGGGQWADYNYPEIICHGSGVQIINHDSQSNLVGTLLLGLPNGQHFPSDYVIEVQLQQASTSHEDFGVYFRNQPGKAAGVYTFLIHPDGSWSAYVYDNTTGNPTAIKNGSPSIDAYAPLTVDVVVSGSHFSFYVNSNQVGSASDTTYSQGTPGIVVDGGGTIFASNFKLYTVAG